MNISPRDRAGHAGLSDTRPNAKAAQTRSYLTLMTHALVAGCG
jgi:hypothetical protein